MIDSPWRLQDDLDIPEFGILLPDLDVLSDAHWSQAWNSSLPAYPLLLEGSVGLGTPASNDAGPNRRVASLAIPWQILHTQEKLHVPSTFVWLELHRPCSPPPRHLALQQRNRSNLVQAQQNPRRRLPANNSLALIRLASFPVDIHITFCPNGATTRRILLSVLLWNSVRLSTPVPRQ